MLILGDIINYRDKNNKRRIRIYIEEDNVKFSDFGFLLYLEN